MGDNEFARIDTKPSKGDESESLSTLLDGSLWVIDNPTLGVV